MKIDVDDAEELSTSCNIKAMPTFRVYQNSKIIREFVGSSRDNLETIIVEATCLST
jgi:hypothetical protein